MKVTSKNLEKMSAKATELIEIEVALRNSLTIEKEGKENETDGFAKLEINSLERTYNKYSKKAFQICNEIEKYFQKGNN